MLPLHLENLVRPGHIDVAGFEIGAVLADHGHMEREAAPHGFGDRQLDRLLRCTRFGPEALDDPAAVLDFDIRAGLRRSRCPRGP